MIADVMRALATAFVFVCLFAFAANVNAKHENNNARPASQLYRKYCVSCHGNDGRAKTSKGKFSHARDLTDPKWQEEVSDERIFNSIMNGRNVRGNMPAFAEKIDAKEVEAMVTLVRGLKGPKQ